MNRQQAKEILVLYRPETADAEDPAFAEALRLCESDAELKEWFDDHRAVYAALRDRFRQSPVAEGLKEQILAEQKSHMSPRRIRPLAAAIALLIVLAAAGSVWLHLREKARQTAFLDRTVSYALRGYAMNFASNDPDEIRAWLAEHKAPSSYALPASLQKATLTGCAVQTWEGRPISMICFTSGTSQIPGQVNDVWLFVADRGSIPGAPDSPKPSVAPVNRTTTARWSEGNLTYLLVADGDEAFLQKYL